MVTRCDYINIVNAIYKNTDITKLTTQWSLSTYCKDCWVFLNAMGEFGVAFLTANAMNPTEFTGLQEYNLSKMDGQYVWVDITNSISNIIDAHIYIYKRMGAAVLKEVSARSLINSKDGSIYTEPEKELITLKEIQQKQYMRATVVEDIHYYLRFELKIDEDVFISTQAQSIELPNVKTVYDIPQQTVMVKIEKQYSLKKVITELLKNRRQTKTLQMQVGLDFSNTDVRYKLFERRKKYNYKQVLQRLQDKDYRVSLTVYLCEHDGEIVDVFNGYSKVNGEVQIKVHNYVPNSIRKVQPMVIYRMELTATDRAILINVTD